jgi:hypothetical protein
MNAAGTSPAPPTYPNNPPIAPHPFRKNARFFANSRFKENKGLSHNHVFPDSAIF